MGHDVFKWDPDDITSSIINENHPYQWIFFFIESNIKWLQNTCFRHIITPVIMFSNIYIDRDSLLL